MGLTLRRKIVNYVMLSLTGVCTFFAVGMLLFGGSWYLRNWLLTGSPLYPKEFLRHPDVLSQIYPDVARTSFFGNRNPALRWQGLSNWIFSSRDRKFGFPGSVKSSSTTPRSSNKSRRS